MLYHYLKIAFKQIRRQKLVSAINIGGLSIGIASFLIIVLWIKGELSYDRFYENADRIYRVAFYYPPFDVNGSRQPGALPQYLKDTYQEVVYASHLQEGEFKLSYGDNGFFALGNTVEPDFSSIFSFPLVQGSLGKLLNDPGSIVLTESLGKKIFGDEDPMGKTLMFNDYLNFTVTGVLKDLPENTHLNFEFLIPFNPNENWRTWDFKNGDSYVMLAENADVEAFNAKIRGVIDLFKPEWNNELFLQPLVQDHLYPIQGVGAATHIFVFSSIAVIILLIACVNFTNLTIAQAEKRHKEIGVKKVSGSSRAQLAFQFFTESIVLAFISALIGVLMVELLAPVVNMQLGLNLEVDFTWPLMLAVGGIVLAVGFISGSYPAMLLSALRPQGVFKSSILESGRPALVRKALVIGQFAVSILFIIGVFSTHKQINFMMNKDLGFDKENLLMVQTRGAIREKLPVVKQNLLKSSQVSGVAVSANNLFDVVNSGPLNYPGKQEGDDAEYIEFWYNWVDEDFLKTLDIELLEGKFFSKEGTYDQQTGFIVNETAIKAMGLKDPIGQQVSAWFGTEGSIIGVVKDFHISSLHQKIAPMVLLYSDRNNHLLVRLKPGDLRESVADVGRTIHEIVPDDPFDYHFVDETVEELYQMERRSGNLIKLSAVLAIFISALGLFSLSAQTIEKRTKEIGIRKVNGASTSSVVFLLNRDFLLLVIISFIIAAPVSWFLVKKWLSEFAYKTDLSLWVFVMAGVLAFLVAFFTVSWQSWKAARKNPVDSLRYE
jgi:ABC-type antimicrobial peptide transport system permease subunit